VEVGLASPEGGGQFGLDSRACREASIPRCGGRPALRHGDDGGRTAAAKGGSDNVRSAGSGEKTVWRREDCLAATGKKTGEVVVNRFLRQLLAGISGGK
jgi:hypothetical protein